MNLINRVLKQIEQDVANRDFTALEELLEHVPESILEGFISTTIDDYDDSQDGDLESGLASAGWGTDEDYGYYGDDGC